MVTVVSFMLISELFPSVPALLSSLYGELEPILELNSTFMAQTLTLWTQDSTRSDYTISDIDRYIILIHLFALKYDT